MCWSRSGWHHAGHAMWIINKASIERAEAAMGPVPGLALLWSLNVNVRNFSILETCYHTFVLVKSVTIICICNVTLSKGNFKISFLNLVNFYYSYTSEINKMVKVTEKNINEVAKCRITANSDYNPESANIIARHELLRLFKLSPITPI